MQERARERAEARRRKGRRRYIAIGVGVVVVLIAAFVARSMFNQRAVDAHAELAGAAGCGDVREVGNLGREHVEGTAVEYDTSPPVGGDHNPSPLPARVYAQPFSTDPTQSPNLYSAVHSLEHGYVIVWHDGLSEDELSELETTYRNEHKVIVVPYPELEDDTVALTAWGRLQTCKTLDIAVIDSFVDLYRESNNAPEPSAP